MRSFGVSQLVSYCTLAIGRAMTESRFDIDQSHFEWTQYSRLRRRYFAFFLGCIPVAIAIGCLAAPFLQRDGVGLLAVILFFGWIATVKVSEIHLSDFRCPRCRERFCFKWGFTNPFTRQCRHCGIPTGTIGSRAEVFR